MQQIQFKQLIYGSHLDLNLMEFSIQYNKKSFKRTNAY